MKDLQFIPYGAQYYRAPTPLPEDWEKDLKAIRNHGFNTVKLWAQWGWNMPAEDTFDFSDLDVLMDICADVGLKVIINIIYDVAPHWFYTKYSDSVMITADGRKLYSQPTAWRQIGGAPGPCLHHPEGVEIRRRFTEEVAKRYADHPAMLCWDLWNEPELTCGIVREQLKENVVCYCEHSVQQFREWLKEKYGTLEVVNRRWGRCYRSFDDIQPPRFGNTYNDMIDWRTFFEDTMTSELRMRAQAVRRIDKNHTVMIHSVPGFDYVNCCADDYKLAKEVDWYGNSNGGSPYSIACIVGAADTPWILNAELHALGGNTMVRPRIPSRDDLKSHILVPFGGGVKGFLFWQYRPERLGWESPAWGLTAMDGSTTPWLEYSAQLNDALQKNADRLLYAFPKSPKVAVVRSGKSETFLWAMDDTKRLHARSVEGAHMACYCANLPAVIITENQLIEQGLSGYDVVYYTLPYYVDIRAAEVLRSFVEQGGTLISETLFGGFHSEDNLHTVTMPGYGFDKVFGCVEEQMTTASVFRNAYEGNWAESEADIASVVMRDENGETGRGYHFRQTLKPTTAKPIGWFENGEIAVTVNTYGKGKAVMIGSCPSYMVGRYSCDDSSRWIASLIQRVGGVKTQAHMTNGRHCDILYRNDKPEMVILQWYGDTGREIRLTDPALFNKRLVNPMDETVLTVDGNGLCRVPDHTDKLDMYMVED